METQQTIGDVKTEKKEVENIVINSLDFDLENYINNYTGHTKIQRLLFIAEHCKSLELDAYKIAVDELKKSFDTLLYKNVIEKIGGRLGQKYTLDQVWMENIDKKAAQEQEKLENDLNNFKVNQIRESIRMGHQELGDFFYQRGDLSNALKCYVRTRDYCTSPKHIIQMCLNVIKVSIEMKNFAHVSSYISKAEQTPDINDKSIIAKLNACSALTHLANRRLKHAAQKFVETTIDFQNDFSDVISPQDVAIYGGLCSLSSFERSELKKKVIDNQSFRNFLELVPEIRELINDFYESRYASCLKYLDKLKPSLLLDIYLHEHIEQIYQKIRDKALVQYFSPFISVNLNTMAEAFNTTVSGLEKELAKLIMENQIQARIDSHNKRLYAEDVDQRSATFEKTLIMGEEYEENTKALLLRLNLLKNDLTVKLHTKDK